MPPKKYVLEFGGKKSLPLLLKKYIYDELHQGEAAYKFYCFCRVQDVTTHSIPNNQMKTNFEFHP